MHTNQQRVLPMIIGGQPGKITRRDTLRLLGAAGLAAVAHTPGRGASAQGGTPEAVPATPTLGLQPDGTRVWRVQVAGGREEEVLEFNTFFPRELTINAGDTIFFDFKGLHAPHTVTFLSGQDAPPFPVPADDMATPSGAEPPMLMLNPEAVFPSGGDVYDGTAVLNSGLSAMLPPDQTFTVTFSQPGVFDYLCLVHPLMMKGTITVQDQGAALPYEQTDIDGMAAEHMNRLLEEGRALIAKYSASPTPTIGADGGRVWDIRAGVEGEEVAVFHFLPDKIAIKVGDTVRWTNESEHEPHTVTFLGGEPAPDCSSRSRRREDHRNSY